MDKLNIVGGAALAKAYVELKAEKENIQTQLSDRCHRLVVESDEKDGEWGGG